MNTNIEELKQRATYSEEALNNHIENMKATYIPTESFYWTNPGDMLVGLQAAFKAGYTPCNSLLHSILPPSYYQCFLYKPESQQQADLYQIIQRARENYAQSVADAKEALFEAMVEEEYKKEEAKAQAKAEQEQQKRKEAIRTKLEKEYK